MTRRASQSTTPTPNHRLNSKRLPLDHCATTSDDRIEVANRGGTLTDDGESLDLTQTLTGRLRNFPLAPSPDNSLWAVYESVSNSLHAIRDAQVPAGRGRVDIQVNRDTAGEVDGFTITDNGIGLTQDNFNSFRKIDSTYKAVRGGKGVGRLTWLKTFEKADVSSTFSADGSFHTRTFEFLEDDQKPIRSHRLERASGPAKTVIELRSMKDAYKRECPKRADTIVRSIVRHFLKDVISKDGPEIFVTDDGIHDLRKVFDSSIIRRQESSFS